MSYIPKLAIELQPFKSVEEMNHHMNLHYLTFKNKITDRFNEIFFLIKKYACLVAGVCWLKQESLASLANVSVKTVERAGKIFKEWGVLKIYHTKRANGLNGNCYYVLQPFQGELVMDDEEISMVEEVNVGAVEEVQTVGTGEIEDDFSEDKLLLSSNKALESSIKKEIEEDIIYNARVESNSNRLHTSKQPFGPITEEDYYSLEELLFNNQFSREAAREITHRVLQKSEGIILPVLMSAFAKALYKFKQRLAYEQPIYSVIDYVVRLIMEEIRPGYSGSKKKQGVKQRYEVNPSVQALLAEVGDWLCGGSTRCVPMLR